MIQKFKPSYLKDQYKYGSQNSNSLSATTTRRVKISGINHVILICLRNSTKFDEHELMKNQREMKSIIHNNIIEHIWNP